MKSHNEITSILSSDMAVSGCSPGHGPKSALRLLPSLRRDIILRAGVVIVHRDGFAGVSCRAVAAACSVPTSIQTVKAYFQHRMNLCHAIAEHARAEGVSTVIGEARRLGF